MLKSLIISPRGGLETEGLFEREEGSFNFSEDYGSCP